MGRYRYRTRVLIGPWRDTAERAAADAVRSRQARFEADDAGLVWLVPGTIELADDRGQARGLDRDEA
ncbi:MAG: hypothetical protein KF780_12920 [Sphingomonas sp.]|nr:hypothetical protein [Sphingomonas sp.]